MLAHVVTFQGSGQDIGTTGMKGFNERVLPVLQQQEGFQGALVLYDRAQAKFLGITLWDNEDHGRAAGMRLEQERQTGMTEMGADSPTPEIYEVLSQVAANGG
jgi:hypothetical protein